MSRVKFSPPQSDVFEHRKKGVLKINKKTFSREGFLPDKSSRIGVRLLNVALSQGFAGTCLYFSTMLRSFCDCFICLMIISLLVLAKSESSSFFISADVSE